LNIINKKNGSATVRAGGNLHSTSESNDHDLFLYSVFPELVQIDHIIRVFERLRIHELSIPTVACGIRAILCLLGFGGLNQLTEGILNMYYPSTCSSTTRMHLVREALSSLGTTGLGNGKSSLVGIPIDYQWLRATAINEETGATATLTNNSGNNIPKTTDRNDTSPVIPLPLRCTLLTSSVEDLVPSLHALTGCEQTVLRLGYEQNGIVFGPSVRIIISAEDFATRLIQASEVAYNALSSVRETERRKEEEKRIINYAEHISDHEPVVTQRTTPSTSFKSPRSTYSIPEEKSSDSPTDTSSGHRSIRGENGVEPSSVRSPVLPSNVSTSLSSFYPSLESPLSKSPFTSLLSLGPATYDILDISLSDTLMVPNLESIYHIPTNVYQERSNFLRRTSLTPITILKKDRLGKEIEYINPLLFSPDEQTLDDYEMSLIMIPALRRTFAHMRECYFYSVYMNLFANDKYNTLLTTSALTNNNDLSIKDILRETEATNDNVNTFLHMTAVEYPNNMYRTLGSIVIDPSLHQPLGFSVPLTRFNSSKLITSTRRYIRGLAWNKLTTGEALQPAEVFPYSNQSTINRLWQRLIISDEDNARQKRANEDTRRAIAAVSIANL